MKDNLAGEAPVERPVGRLEPEWNDPCVQAAYAILCSEDAPPDGEHWEGFAARRIVAVVRAAERERCAKLCEPTGPRHCDCERCCCGNATDARMVAEWDEAAALARRIRDA